MNYDYVKIEKKWQGRWHKDKLYQPDMDSAKHPYYNLMMFPYLSAEGLHVGNMYAFTGSDIWGRFQRMHGFDVFEPIGLDGFGIHSENYAIKIGEHIRDVSKRTEKHFYEQLMMTGNQYDWSRCVETFKPNYYKWTQWLFLQMYKNGLAYRKKATVNWCPSCKTVLSDEQVEGGVCERCKTKTTTKDIEQWFWKITDYAEKLLKNLEWINWSEEVKIGQKNWIGKSEGAKLKFEIKNSPPKADQPLAGKSKTQKSKKNFIEVFTTRPDTIYGAIFMVVAPEHEILEKFRKDIKNYKEVEEYVTKAKKKSDIERTDLNKDKSGIRLDGITAVNPANNEQLPIFVADYVLINYGSGAIMGVPAHDERDFEFSNNYKLDIIPVIEPPIGEVATQWVESDKRKMEHFSRKKVLEGKQVYVGAFGKIINSELFEGLSMPRDQKKILAIIKEEGWGEVAVTYKLRDWCISRQRYWGAPIPMIYCQKCGWQSVREDDLPVLLPDIPEFKDVLPDGSGQGPLARQESFVSTKCLKCKGEARRETDVMDPFVDSCWYYLRYPSTEFENKPFDKLRVKKWLPVDMYIGGKEHTVLHLLYSRFVTMALKDFEFIDFEEPFERFFGHGLLICEGAKMSKSKGNVVNPDEYIAKYGADAVRMYLMFLGDFKQGGDWRDTGMRGMYRFVKKIWGLFEGVDKDGDGNVDLSMIHKTILGVEKDIKRLSFNTAIAKIMEYANWYKEKEKNFSKVQRKNVLETLCLVLAPFAPHISEELWERLGNKRSIHQQRWPKYDEELIKEGEITIAVQINGKLRDTVRVRSEAEKEEVEKVAMDSEKVRKYLSGKVKKVVFVKNRIINFVLEA